MLKFMEGFDQLRDVPSDGSPSVLAGYLNASGYTVSGAVSMDIGRVQEQRCLKLGDGTATVGSIKRVFNSTQTKAVLGFAYSAVAKRNAIVAINNLGTLTWDESTGKVSFAGGTGTATILLGLWYYFEIIVDKTAGLVTVYVNNGKDIEVALPSSAQFLTAYDCTWSSAADDAKKLDDIYFLDNATGKYVDRMGPITIQTRMPTTDIDKEWSPSTGTDHWPLVSNQPPVDTEFVQSNTSGATDTYRSNEGIPAGAQILAVGITALNRKSDIDARQLGMVVGQKGQTQKEVVDADLSTTPKYSYAVFESAPGDAAWDATNVTTIPFGVVVRP